MDIITVPFLLLVKSVLSFAIVIVLADVLLSWLVAANIYNNQNKFVWLLVDTINKVSNLMLDPIRKRIKFDAGGLDISPVLLVLCLTFIEDIVTRIIIRIS